MTKLKLYAGDCLQVLRKMRPDTVAALVTDPPAGIAFMGKSWDDDKGGRDAWVAWLTEVMRECYRVMKPGAHGLVWALPRTSHWTGTALEDAGFEVRDRVQHLFGTGFPKSLDVSKAIDKMAGAEREVVGNNPNARSAQENYALDGSAANFRATYNPLTAPATDSAKQWSGWGTALKPACEDWWLVRKPLSEKTVAANVLKWGTGGINIDGTRIGTNETLTVKAHARGPSVMVYPDKPGPGSDKIFKAVPEFVQSPQGRFPSHLLLDEEAAAILDEQSGVRPGDSANRGPRNNKAREAVFFGQADKVDRTTTGHNDTGGASRFFYVAKASKSDKEDGLYGRSEETVDDGRQTPIDNPYLRGKTGRRNTHPTVKSTKLMEYLVKLITPPGGIVLDPFTGSGSTGVAALRLGFPFVGIEKEPEYLAISLARLEAAAAKAQEAK